MRHTYNSQSEKRRDFWLAFIGWFVVNAVAIFLIQSLTLATASSGKGGPSSVGPAFSGLLVLANVAVPIVLAFLRGYLAFGIVVAFATALALTIVEGVFFTVGDFVAGATGNFGASIVFLVLGFLLYAIGAFFVLRRIHRGIK